MNLKRIIWTSCFAAVVLTASFALGAPHRGGGSMGMRGGQTFSHGGMGTWGGRNWNGGNWGGRNWNGGNWSGRNWNGGNWSGRNWSGGNWSGNWRHPHHGGSDFMCSGDVPRLPTIMVRLTELWGPKRDGQFAPTRVNAVIAVSPAMAQLNRSFPRQVL